MTSKHYVALGIILGLAVGFFSTYVQGTSIGNSLYQSGVSAGTTTTT